MDNEKIEAISKNVKSVDKSVLFYRISTDAPCISIKRLQNKKSYCNS